jgi:hypothetical protein
VTQGLYQQAYTDAVVQDWRGYIEIFASLMPHWGNDPIEFKGMTVNGGITIDGIRKRGKLRLVIHPGPADSARLKISSLEGTLKVEGDVDTIGSLKAGEITELKFKEGRDVIITSE